MENILDVIYSRRSIRVFKHEDVPQAVLADLLKAAMAAPSASNSRPYEFVVIEDKTTLKTLQAKMPHGKYNAAAIICVLGNTAIAANESAYHYWVQDCTAATENILIAAAGLGLGTVWVGVYPKEIEMDIVRSVLGIPADVFPLNLIYLGYPNEDKAARTQYEEKRVHWNKYRDTLA
jgi:nitroreductase